MKTKFELRPSELRCLCDPAIFKFKDTSEIEPLDEVIGQQRAVQAIEFGLDMKSPGYNIFVTGQEGTGKTTIVKNLMLKKEVIEAVEKGRFHIYQVSTVAEGIAVLTGVAAGRPDDAGDFPAGTVFGAVQKKLKEYTQQAYRLKKEFESLY